ncbi:MAG TPA: DNA polymerase III subunit delta [Actinomycetes bacterium]|nr:DNA polymerase III subunit delta [Actinomycetes bacterium]
MSQPPPRVTLVVGPEEVLVDRAVEVVVQAARAVDPQTDVRRLDPGSLEPGVLREAASPSLFGERSVLVVRRAHELSEELSRELVEVLGDDSAPDIHVVVCHEGAANRGKAVLEAARRAGAEQVAAEPVKRLADRLAFVQGEFRAAKRRISEPAARALVESIGEDLGELASACSQLISDTTGSVDVEQVRRYYEGRADVTSFAVADRALEGRAAEALEMLRYALGAGVAPVLVTSALASSLRSMVLVGSATRGLPAADLARQAGLPPWKVDVVRRQLRGWTPDGLSDAIRAVATADADVKGAASDPGYALERAVVAVTEARAG